MAGTVYQSCSSSGESACCGTNHSGAGQTGVADDVCGANGLCQDYEGSKGTNVTSVTSGLSTTAKAGIGAGVAVLIILLGVILLLLHKVKGARKQELPWEKAELAGQINELLKEPQTTRYINEVGIVPVELLDHVAALPERNTQTDPAELATGDWRLASVSKKWDMRTSGWN